MPIEQHGKIMKALVLTIVALGLLTQQSFSQGAQGAQITQRARELVNQNNVRQGVGQPSQPATPPRAAQPQKPTAPNPAQIQQQNVNKIKNDIAAIIADSQVAQDKVQKLAADLLSAARGTKKPSSVALGKLAASLGSNLAGKTLGSQEQSRLAQDLEAVVNSSKLSQLQVNAYVSDVQAILQVAGAKHNDAASAAGEVKAVVLGIRY